MPVNQRNILNHLNKRIDHYNNAGLGPAVPRARIVAAHWQNPPPPPPFPTTVFLAAVHKWTWVKWVRDCFATLGVNVPMTVPWEHEDDVSLGEAILVIRSNPSYPLGSKIIPISWGPLLQLAVVPVGIVANLLAELDLGTVGVPAFIDVSMVPE